jgi:hypothetical protein
MREGRIGNLEMKDIVLEDFCSATARVFGSG